MKIKPILIASLLGITSCLSNNKKTNGESNPTENYEQKNTWKTFLKENNVDLFLDVNERPNQFESFMSENRYSNHYYQFAADFPDNWKVDRGNSVFTLYRCYVADSALTLSLIVVPNKVESQEEAKRVDDQFLESPILASCNSMSKKMSEVFMTDYITENTGVKPQDLTMSEVMVRSRNYLKSTYNYIEITEGIPITFIYCSFTTVKFGLTYTFNYSAPEFFYDQAVIDDLVFSANYAKLDY